MPLFMVEILIHYWCDDLTDYNEGDFSKPAIRDAIDMLVDHAILQPAESKGPYPRKYRANSEALEPYIRAIEAVRLPVRKTVWELPKAEADGVLRAKADADRRIAAIKASTP